MAFSQTLNPALWSALVEAFGREKGSCVFDVPDRTDRAAPVRVLCALPARFWEDNTGTSALDQAARKRIPETDASVTARQPDYWLPLKLGFVGYRDGEPVIGASARPCATPSISVFEYDWAIVLERDANHLTLFMAEHCPEPRRQLIRDCIAQAEAGSMSPAAARFHLTDDFHAAQSREDYLDRLARIQEYILAGDVYQVNYAQQFHAPFDGDPITAFPALYEASPSPCSVYLDTGRSQILSLSPERFLRVKNGAVETRPIKGTRRRGDTPEEDEAMRQELLQSPKDRAENLMIVDLLRNDLGKCCEIGSVEAHPLFALETFSNVHHLVSAVRGQLKAQFTPLDLLLSAFPGGSITGAPKRRAMEIIRELEPVPRGAYCGSFFHWSPGNGFDSTIAIRTLECRDGVVDCKGGGGIVADSVPEEEYQESITKIRLFMEVLERLERGAREKEQGDL